MRAPAAGDRFDAPGRVAFVNALFVIGTLGTLITPALLAAWARLHWTQSQQGVVAAIELATMAVGSLSGLYWQRRWNWRRVTLVSLLLGAGANIACLPFDSFIAVCLCRGAAGLSAGFLCGIYSAFLANAKSPGRIVAITTFIQIAVEAIFIFSTTSVFALLGSTGLFVLMAALFLILVPLSSVLPSGWPTESGNAGGASAEAQSIRGYPLLLSFLPFIIVQTGVYTFLGEFGRVSAHLDVEQTLRAISVSIIFSSLGSIAAYFLSDRIGLIVPIALAISLMIGTLCAMVFASSTPLLFLTYISLLQIAWVFLNCYLYSALIAANNLLVPAALPLASFGAAFGASAMGYVLQHGGPIGSLSFSVGAMLVTALLTIPFLRRVSSTEKKG